MKIKNGIPLAVCFSVLMLSLCAQNGQGVEKNPLQGNQDMIRIHISVGQQTFAALFYDNEAAQLLIRKMPLTVSMNDLNRNEKYAPFPATTDFGAGERPSVIREGELMLWSGNTLVLFYKTFHNSYSGYIKIGYIEHTGGLGAALGTENISVTFTVP